MSHDMTQFGELNHTVNFTSKVTKLFFTHFRTTSSSTDSAALKGSVKIMQPYDRIGGIDIILDSNLNILDYFVI